MFIEDFKVISGITAPKTTSAVTIWVVTQHPGYRLILIFSGSPFDDKQIINLI